MALELQPPGLVNLQLPGLYCRAQGLAYQAGSPEDGHGCRPVIGANGRQVSGIDLHVSVDGVQLFDCSAVFLGADGHTGVVHRWDLKAALDEATPPKRYTQRGQVKLWL